MEPRQPLPTEFAITIANGDVWLAISLALVLGFGCWVFGTWVARTVGLFGSSAPAGEILGVGLGVGLMVLSAWWAAIWSGGRSSFTPVAIGFAIALGAALVGRRQPRSLSSRDRAISEPRRGPGIGMFRPRRSLVVTGLLGAAFVIAIALLYGATVAPSPRDGVQPIEFNDVAYYAVLGRDLATTGTETVHSASGFTDIPGLPDQSWYHWAEIWLASAVITVFGTAPMAARYFIVLPIVLLAAAALTGTIARRAAGTSSRRVFLFGVLACLFLAPVPLAGTFFSSWPAGMVFGINLYGLAAVAVLFAMYCFVVLRSRAPSWALSGLVGTGIAYVLPAHVAIGLLGLIGFGSAWALRVARSLAPTRRLLEVRPPWPRTAILSAVLVVATVGWGLVTGHALGGASSPTIVAPFSASWGQSVALTTLGAGVFLAIAVAWFLGSRASHPRADWFFGTLVMLFGGAIGWGARLGDFTMFYLLYGGIAVIATPVAVIAVRALWERAVVARRRGLAIGIVVLCLAQLEAGAFNGIQRLRDFGAQGDEAPISLSMLDEIRRLPEGARLAYSCRPLDESGFGVPQLLSIDAHTARRVIPMCFEAEVLSVLAGAERSEHVENLYFRGAPQRLLYPDAGARPSRASVADFLRVHGIRFIYADAKHPNALLEDAHLVIRSPHARVLEVP